MKIWIHKRIVIRLLAVFIVLAAWTPYFHRLTSLKALTRVIFSSKPVQIMTFRVPSVYQEGESRIDVLLPSHFVKDKPYRVLYILPTVPEKWDFWWNSGLIEAYENNIPNRYNLICVAVYIKTMPWIADNPGDPRIRQESHIAQAVVPFIDAHFPTVRAPEGRFLLGISKSGNGAYTLLLRNLGLFGKAVGFDAPLMMETIHQVPQLKSEKIYGTDENFRNYFFPELVKRHAALLRHSKPRIILLGYADLLEHLQQAHHFLEKLGIPHIYDVKIQRRHNWQSGWFSQAVEYLVIE